MKYVYTLCIEKAMKNNVKLLLGDSKQQLSNLAPNSVDLIFTSPPYAEPRKNTYGGVSQYKYVDWFMPIADELFEVLKPTGTFVLNIKESAFNGERSTYTIDLIKNNKF